MKPKILEDEVMLRMEGYAQWYISYEDEGTADQRLVKNERVVRMTELTNWCSFRVPCPVFLTNSTGWLVSDVVQSRYLNV